MFGQSKFLSTGAMALAFANFAAAQLSKPLIVPAMPALDAGLLANLSPPSFTIDYWSSSPSSAYIPEDCKGMAEGEGLSPSDVEAFSIRYADCDTDPWVFCRHYSAPIGAWTMADTFGRMPVKSRQFVRHMLAVPGPLSAGSSGDNIVMKGWGTNLMTIFLHETAHSMDSHAITALSFPFHDTTEWLTAYATDPAISDDYAQTSQAENFAQTLVISVFDHVVPGGIASVQPSYADIQAQYTTAKYWLGDLIIPGGTCTARLTNSAPVRVRAASRRSRLRAAAVEDGEAPNVSLSDAVEVIPSVPMGKIELTSWA